MRGSAIVRRTHILARSGDGRRTLMMMRPFRLFTITGMNNSRRWRRHFCGITASSSTGRSLRYLAINDLETRRERLFRLERHAQERTVVLAEDQLHLFERYSVDFRCRHVEASRPGDSTRIPSSGAHSTGVALVYVQVLIDVFCSLAFAKIYTSKIPVTYCDFSLRAGPCFL